MRAAVRDGFIGFTSPLEGVCTWMYLDVKGLVTTGYGNLIDSQAKALESRWWKVDGTEATEMEVRDEWTLIKRSTGLAKAGANAAARVAKLRLGDDDLERLVFRVLDKMNAELVKRYPSFEDWPADAQMATLAMAWACGPAFGRSFKVLARALDSQDWAAASQRCTINSKGNAGVIPRNKAMRQLFFLAAAVPCDPEELHWPADEQVKAWQAQRGLVPDGLVGPKTLAAL